MEKSNGRAMKKPLTIMIITASAYNAICGGFYSPVDYTQCGWVKTTKSENGQIETKYNFSPGMSDDPKCSVYTEKRQNFSSLPSYASLDEAQSAALDQAIKKYNSDVPGKTLSEKQRNAEMAGSTMEVIKEDGTHAWINISLASLSGEGGTPPRLYVEGPSTWKVVGLHGWHTGVHTDERNGVKMTGPSNTDAKGLLKGERRSETIFDLNDDGSYSSVRLKNNGEIWSLQNGQWTRIDNTPDYRAFCGDDGRENTKRFLADPDPKNDRSDEPYCPLDDLSSQTISEDKSTVDNNTENSEPHEAKTTQKDEYQKITIDGSPIYGSITTLEAIAKNGYAARIGNINQAAINVSIKTGDKWYQEQKALVSALPNDHPQKAEALEAIEMIYAKFCKLKDQF